MEPENKKETKMEPTNSDLKKETKTESDDLNLKKTVPKIEQLTIEKIKIETDDPELKKLLPNIEREKVSFYLKNVNVSVANAIRRVICGELPIKYLTCDIHDINTNEEFIKLEELINRINFIPINQDIPDDMQFSLSVVNSDAKQRYKIVHSSDIVIKTDNFPQKIFAETFRLAELNPTKYLSIPKIKVVKDFGFNYAASCLTLDFEYYIIDYISVKFVNEQANFVSKRVSTTELINLFKKYKVQTTATFDNLFKKKILVIPNKSYQKRLTAKQLKNISTFDIVLENPESFEVTSLNVDDKFLKNYQSAETTPKHFYMSFQTYGNISADKLLPLAKLNISARLNNFRKELLKYINGDQTSEIVNIIQDNIKTKIIIRGEDHTMGNLLSQMIFELDPNIGLINTPLIHPLNRTIILNIIHPQAIKITMDAVDKLLTIFQEIIH